MPYTYLIGWTKQKKYYYGVRYAKGCKPKELWKSYFTSSKHVKQFREEYGEPDVIQVRKTFKCSSDARNWENKVLNRIGAKDRIDFLNLTDNKSISLEAASKGRENIDYKKVGESLRNFYKTGDKEYIEQIKENRRLGLENKSKESYLSQSKGIREYQIKSWSDPDIKEKRSKSMRKPKSKIKCPHCNKIGGSGIMKRWHFDNCKAVATVHGG